MSYDDSLRLAGGPVHQVFVKPGDWCFAEEPLLMRTVLGACVALTVWHPLLRYGGMCHYLHAQRPGAAACAQLDARYADEAMELLLGAMHHAGTRPADYRLKLFGGARRFPTAAMATGHAGRPHENLEAGVALARRHGLALVPGDVGGSAHRQVVFDSWSGEAWVRHHEGDQVRCDGCGWSGECSAQ